MEDINNVRQQINEQRTQLNESRKQLEEAKKSVQSIGPRVNVSRRDLIKQDLKKREVLRQANISKGKEKQSAIKEISSNIKEQNKIISAFESKAQPVERQLKEIEDFEKGRKLAMSNKPQAVFALENKTQRKGWRAGRSDIRANEKMKEELSEVTKGLTGTERTQALKDYASDKRNFFVDLNKSGKIGEYMAGKEIGVETMEELSKKYPKLASVSTALEQKRQAEAEALRFTKLPDKIDKNILSSAKELEYQKRVDVAESPSSSGFFQTEIYRGSIKDIGNKIGNVLRNPSIIIDTIKNKKYSMTGGAIIDLNTGVYREATEYDMALPSEKEYKDSLTIGEVAVVPSIVFETASRIGGKSAKIALGTGLSIGGIKDDDILIKEKVLKVDVPYPYLTRGTTQYNSNRQPILSIEEEKYVPAKSKKQFLEGFEKGATITTAVGLGLVIPIAGDSAIYLSDVVRRTQPYDYSIKDYVKNNKQEALIMGVGGIALGTIGLGAIGYKAGSSYLNRARFYSNGNAIGQGEVLGELSGGNMIYRTTRKQQILGQRFRFDFDAGVIKRFKNLDAKPLDIFKPTLLTEDLVPNNLKPFKEPVFITDSTPTKVGNIKGTDYEIYDDVTGFNRQIKKGIQVEVFSLESEKAISLRPSQFKKLYSGNPFTKAGKVERTVLFERLNDGGISEDFSKQIVRLRRPEILEESFKGNLLVAEKGGNKLYITKGSKTEKYVDYNFGDIKSKIKSGKVEKISTKAEPLFNLGDEEVIKGTIKRESVGLTNKAIIKGKKVSTEEFTSSSKKVGTTDVEELNIGNKQILKVEEKNLNTDLLLGETNVGEDSLIRVRSKGGSIINPKTKSFESELYQIKSSDTGDIFNTGKSSKAKLLNIHRDSEKEVLKLFDNVKVKVNKKPDVFMNEDTGRKYLDLYKGTSDIKEGDVRNFLGTDTVEGKLRIVDSNKFKKLSIGGGDNVEGYIGEKIYRLDNVPKKKVELEIIKKVSEKDVSNAKSVLSKVFKDKEIPDLGFGERTTETIIETKTNIKGVTSNSLIDGDVRSSQSKKLEAMNLKLLEGESAKKIEQGLGRKVWITLNERKASQLGKLSISGILDAIKKSNKKEKVFSKLKDESSKKKKASKLESLTLKSKISKNISKINNLMVQKELVRRPSNNKPPQEGVAKIIATLLSKKRNQLKSSSGEESFEAVGIRYGKEVSLGKGTRSDVAKDLSKFLSGTLGASGFLKKGKEKILAEDTGLLSDFSLRRSKRDRFKVVERKSSRLRRGGTGKDIQAFRRVKKISLI